MNALDLLKERGFVKQITFEEDLYKAFENEVVPFYVGFDPTADSLHIGHYIPIMAMAHLQKAGHKPFALMGGGTGMIGDPSGKSDLRKVLTVEDIDHNVECFKKQNLNLLCCQLLAQHLHCMYKYVHGIYIALGIISQIEMI